MDQGLITLIVALAGAAGTILSFLAGRRERVASAIHKEASAAAMISEGYLNLVNSLEGRVAELEELNRAELSRISVQQEKLDAQAIELMELRTDNARLIRDKEALADRIKRLEAEVAEIKRQSGLVDPMK